ncbi:hypothetical protein PIB30_041870 [Stylosanthes scabra]|uniref:Uncharacterized protein n=1 Tax=Stylosanthes scabra TaxID=79078 RepID=A0ABU6VDJ0_9FABA|nr:hypothetical protein [Stylosanthes scabra]
MWFSDEDPSANTVRTLCVVVVCTPLTMFQFGIFVTRILGIVIGPEWHLPHEVEDTLAISEDQSSYIPRNLKSFGSG